MFAFTVHCEKEYGGCIADKPGQEIKPCTFEKHCNSKTTQRNDYGDHYRATQRIVIELRQESSYIFNYAAGMVNSIAKEFPASEKERIIHGFSKCMIDKTSVAK